MKVAIKFNAVINIFRKQLTIVYKMKGSNYFFNYAVGGGGHCKIMSKLLSCTYDIVAQGLSPLVKDH